jgi:hypothetical protein
MTVDAVSKKLHFKKPISDYISSATCGNIQGNNNNGGPSSEKRMKFDDTVSGSSSKNLLDTPTSSTQSMKSTTATTRKYTLKFEQNAYNTILNKLYVWFENQSATFQFPKETFRYFLVTYSKFIQPKDFINTGSIAKVDKRSKTANQLVNGAILYEYCKGIDTFISSMSRTDSLDIAALKFVVQNNITLPSKIYEILLDITFTPTTYVQDTESTHHKNYSIIPISNNKQMFVLLTSDIVAVYDGHQFIPPTANIEREFNMGLRDSSELKHGEYILLEVMFSSKTKVIDMIKYRCNNCETVPTRYIDRLAKIKEILPNAHLAVINPNATIGDGGYIQKPIEGFGPSYIYHKSNLTAAAIGMFDKNIILGFLSTDDKQQQPTIVVKAKASISNTVFPVASIMPLQQQPHSNEIIYNGEKYKITGDLKDVRLFRKIIPIEFRDGNRLGNLSTRPLSLVSDYKPVTMRKESIMLDDMKKQILANPNLFSQMLLEVVQVVQLDTTTKEKLINQLSSIEVSFDGYENENDSNVQNNKNDMETNDDENDKDDNDKMQQ